MREDWAREGEGRAGITEPRRGCALLGLAAPFLFLAVFAGLFLLKWLPAGIRVDGPAPYEGLLTVYDDKAELMSFARNQLLRENEANRAKGRQKSELICVDAPPQLRRRITDMARPLPKERYSDGGRSLWIRMIAERRLGSWPCAGRSSQSGDINTLLRIVSIERIRPLGCDGLVFLLNHLRCPPPRPPPPAPVTFDDKDNQLYPEAARRAGREGTALLRLLVDSRDRLLSCEVARSSGDAELDAASCRLVRTHPPRFPKEGSTKGLATGVREVRQKIVWRLQDEPPQNARTALD